MTPIHKSCVMPVSSVEAVSGEVGEDLGRTVAGAAGTVQPFAEAYPPQMSLA
jgi:hypothetical protein